MKRYMLAIGIVIVLIGISTLPIRSRPISQEPSGFFERNVSSQGNQTITDYLEDVFTIDYYTGESTQVLNSSYIEVKNLDIKEAACEQMGAQVILSLQVDGCIEERGELIDIYNGTIEDLDTVEYDFVVTTSEEDYMIVYCNQTGRLMYDDIQINLTSSDFFVVNDTLFIWFLLSNSSELVENLSATSLYIKCNFSNLEPEELVYLSDLAPNPPLEIYRLFVPAVGFAGRPVQFKASLQVLTGTPPFEYSWDFGDQTTAEELNPTHVYQQPGVYAYFFQVTDRTGAVAYRSYFITIYEVKRTLLLGKYSNWTTEDGLTRIDTVRLWSLQFDPFKLELMIQPDSLRFTETWIGLRTTQKVFGIFEVVVL